MATTRKFKQTLSAFQLRLSRGRRAALASNVRSSGLFSGSAYTLTDNGTSLPSFTSGGLSYLITTSSNSVFRNVGGRILASGITQSGISTNVGGVSSSYSRKWFKLIGQKVALRLQPSLVGYRFIISANGGPAQYISLTPQVPGVTSGSQSYFILDLLTPGHYMIAVETQQDNGLVGAYVDATTVLAPVDATDTLYFVGLWDSYGLGTLSYLATGLAAPRGDGLLVQLFDWLGVQGQAGGVGGTGTTVPTSGTTNKFRDRVVQGELGLSNYPVDAIIINASYNDRNSTYSTCYAAWTDLIAQVRLLYPTTPFLVYGCFPGDTGPSSGDPSIIMTEMAAQQAVTDAIANGDLLIAFIPVSTDTPGPWIQGRASAINFTAALSAATGGTLVTPWARNPGTYTFVFSDGSTRSVVLTANQTAVTWTGAVTATSVAGAYIGTNGNALTEVEATGVHLTDRGTNNAAQRMADRGYAALMALGS